jgi:hypothetical protein
MKHYKNYLIAILTGLLVLSLSTQISQGAPSKPMQYDAVLLAEYSACLNTLDYEQFRYTGRQARDACKWWYPPKYKTAPLSPNLVP